MLTPKLRFKEFTNEWSQELLLNISNSIQYGMNSAATDYDGINKYIRITDINDSNSLFNQNNLVSPLGNLDNKFLVKENDILFARTGASTGKSYLYNPGDGKLYFAGFLIRISINNKYNSRFIFEQFKLKKYDNWVKLMSMRSGQPGINANEYGSYKVVITDKQEQDKIAEFINLLNKKIELQTKKIEALKLHKKGLIQTNRENEAKKVSFESFLKESNEKTTINNQYNILSSTSKGLFLQREYFNKQAASENNVGYKILKKGQLVFSPQNLWMGNININGIFEKGIVSPSYKIFDIDKNIIDVNYFNNWIKTPRALYEYLCASEQGASVVRRNLNQDLFNEITIDLPELAIQQKIGKNLYNFDLKIQLETYKLNKIIQLKKGLLQNLFV